MVDEALSVTYWPYRLHELLTEPREPLTVLVRLREAQDEVFCQRKQDDGKDKNRTTDPHLSFSPMRKPLNHHHTILFIFCQEWLAI